MSKRGFLISLSALLFLCTAAADEGMWLFNAAPKARVKAKYGFEITDPWLDHLRLSSVRFNVGGSGSFVSAEGLAFTNHHVAADCLHGLSTAKHDYMKTGFYAKTRDEEPRCPNLELNVLQQVTDVTDKVNSAVKPGMNDADTGKAQRASMAAIEKDCANQPALRCDVVTLYAGAMYHLYRYKKYTDVRLVFAPEFDMAFFGGDPDNFEFPRYDLDITFFRVYENDKPVHLDDYLHWSTDGAKDGDLVFVSGHPGSTGRLDTINQLEFLKNIQYPFQLKDYERRIALLQKFASESPENARIAQEDIFGLQNSFKAVTGYNAGLLDLNLMKQRLMKERITLIRARHNPTGGGARVLRAFLEIDKALVVHHEIFLPHRFVELRYGFRGTLNSIARSLVRVAEEKKKPNGERLREYRESALPSLEDELFSTAPIYKSLEASVFADSLKEMQKQLGPDNPVVKKILKGKSPDDVARDLVVNTKLDDVSVRKQLYHDGAEAVGKSTDPLLVMMREIDPDARAVRKRYDDEVESPIRQNGTIIAHASFQQGGLSTPPDATFTLRLSYGQVKGYTEDGRGYVPKGTVVSPFTTMGGAFDHAKQHKNKPPYQLPLSWTKKKSKIDPKTHFNFTSTPDIIGGNSGSPVVDKKGELVGIIFDGNIQSLPWRFMYEDAIGRAVSVDSRAIIEALRKIYGAAPLTDELTAGNQAKTSEKK